MRIADGTRMREPKGMLEIEKERKR